MRKFMRESTSAEALKSVEASAEETAMAAVFAGVQASFETFCLVAGIEAMQEMLEREAGELCGERYQRHEGRRGRRTKSPPAFHGGRVNIDRPRVRTVEGKQEIDLPSWTAAQGHDWLGQWAMNQMLINVPSVPMNLRQ